MEVETNVLHFFTFLLGSCQTLAGPRPGSLALDLRSAFHSQALTPVCTCVCFATGCGPARIRQPPTVRPERRRHCERGAAVDPDH